MNSNKNLKIGAILSYISIGLSYLVGIAYTPIMLRLLGQSEYGLYNLVSSIISYLGLMSFGFNGAYIKFFSKYKKNEDFLGLSKLNGLYFKVYTIIGMLSLIVGIGLSFFSKEVFGTQLSQSELNTAQVLLFLMTVNLSLSFVFVVFDSFLVSNEKFIFLKMIQIIKTIFSPFIMLPVLLLGYGSIGLVSISLVLNFIIGIITTYYSIKKLNMRFSFLPAEENMLKEISVFSGFIFINMIVDQINWNVDKFIIGRFYGTAEVAIYSIAAQINMYYITLSTTIVHVFVPRVHDYEQQTNNRDLINLLFVKVGRIQYMIIMPILLGFLMLGDYFISVWAGTGYKDAFIITTILITPLTIPLIQNLGIHVQRAQNKHRFRSLLYLVIAMINIIISIPLTKVYGGIGAAVGTSLSLIVGNILIMNIYYQLNIGIDVKSFWKNIFKLSFSLIPTIVFVFFVKATVRIDTMIEFISYGFVFMLIYCSSIYKFGINKDEKNQIKSLLTIIKRK